MKKNIAMRVASLILMCTIVTSCFVSSTFAKYTSSVSGSDSVTVAKWAIKVNGTDATQTQTATFDLFSTIKDNDGTSEETDVASGKIAPGTSGSFNLAIKNESEVTAKYNVGFEVEGATIPIEYSIDGGTTWKASLDNVAETQIAQGAIANVTVKWRWAFYVDSDHDTTDTAAGISAPTITVTATITATQVD